MYTKKDLEKYEYFANVNIEHAFDSLTGALSRANILGFAKYLIDNKKPFVMSLIDIDNFKDVNDNYGHRIGDECVKQLCHRLIDYVADTGLVGRFGGDEFIIIHFGPTDYDGSYKYIRNLYTKGNIIRRKYNLDGNEVYVTATIGSASYPDDTDNYDDLFFKIDKALYRGKTKGRNCFIVYVESKHKHINVYEKDSKSLATMFTRINRLINQNAHLSVNKRIESILNYVATARGFSQVAFVSLDGKVINSGRKKLQPLDEESLKILEDLVATDEFYTPTGMKKFRTQNPKAMEFFDKLGVLTFVISKVAYFKKVLGYVLLFDTQIERLWQDGDFALSLYLDQVFMTMIEEEKK